MKRFFKSIVSSVFIICFCLSFAACGGTQEFQCDFCARNISDGGKNKINYPYDSNDYFACDDCAAELSEMQDGVINETHNKNDITEAETTTEASGYVQSSIIPEKAKLIAYGYDEYDNLYELVGQQIDMYAGVVNKLGVIKNGEWLISMSDNTPFHDKEGNYLKLEPLLGGRCVNKIYLKEYYSEDISAEIRYIGNGCFYMSAYHKNNTHCVIWNTETNSSFVVSKGSNWDNYNYAIEISLAEKECVVNNDGKILLSHYAGGAQGTEYFLLDTNTMSVERLPFSDNRDSLLGGEVVGPYSEGKIALIKQRGVADSSNGFYDINGKKVIDLSKYLITDYAVAFVNGQATFTTQDYDGAYYLITLDSNGNETSKVAK